MLQSQFLSARTVGLATLATAVAAGSAWAAIPSAEGSINACYDEQGVVSVIDEGVECAAGSTPLHWMQGTPAQAAAPVYTSSGYDTRFSGQAGSLAAPTVAPGHYLVSFHTNASAWNRQGSQAEFECTSGSAYGELMGRAFVVIPAASSSSSAPVQLEFERDVYADGPAAVVRCEVYTLPAHAYVAFEYRFTVTRLGEAHPYVPEPDF